MVFIIVVPAIMNFNIFILVEIIGSHKGYQLCSDTVISTCIPAIYLMIFQQLFGFLKEAY